MRRIPFFNRPSKISLLALSLLLALSGFPAEAAQDPARVNFFHALKSKEEGNLLEAEILLKRAIELEPQNADYHFELANLYVERENLVGARLELEQTVMISPPHLPAQYNLGLVYRELGLMSEARNQFRKVLDLNPTNAKAQLQIGYTYQEEGFFEDAREAFRTAKEMDITDPEPQRALEDLVQLEKEALLRSRRETAETFQRNQSLLFREQQEDGSDAVKQPNGKQALFQTGVLILQELLARRSRASSQSGTNEGVA